jgi:hypothetical protein
MRIFWSRSTGSFFDEAIHGERRISVLDEEALAARIARMEELAAEADMEGEESDAQMELTVLAYGDEPTKLIDNPACLIPADAVEVSRERHAELMAEVAGGKLIVTGHDGQPGGIDPALSIEEQLAALRRRRDRELAATDWTQLPDAMTAAKRKLWKDHRQALRDLPGMVEAAVAKGTPVASIKFPEAPA